MNEYSITHQEGRLKVYWFLMPEVFNGEKIDRKKLEVTLGEDINSSNERYD